MECDQIGAAPYEGCQCTLVKGIKPFVVRSGVKILTICFPVRPVRSSYVSCRGYWTIVASRLALLAVCVGQVWPYLYFWDWPHVASNPCRFRVGYFSTREDMSSREEDRLEMEIYALAGSL
ncbi:hypothetical protein YC2023_033569 [Brassica napus]